MITDKELLRQFENWQGIILCILSYENVIKYIILYVSLNVKYTQ